MGRLIGWFFLGMPFFLNTRTWTAAIVITVAFWLWPSREQWKALSKWGEPVADEPAPDKIELELEE